MRLAREAFSHPYISFFHLLVNFFSVTCLNKDLKPLAEAEFPERGRYLFGDDFGKWAKGMADNVLALKGLHQKGKTPMQYHFSGSSNSNVKRFAFHKLPSRRQIGGAGLGARRSVFNRLNQNPRGHPKSFRNAKNQGK